jgi:hypothetical protein
MGLVRVQVMGKWLAAVYLRDNGPSNFMIRIRPN